MIFDNSKDFEYIFWLDFWRKTSAFWPMLGHFKCVVTREKIHVIRTENNLHEELNVDISSIQKCKLGYTGNNNHHVVLVLNGERFLLGPIHPIDPGGVQNLNHNETSALIKVIEACRSGADLEIDTSPYTRQLSMKNNLKGFNVPDIKWDKHTSPWVYYEQYGDKFLQLKIFIRNAALIIATTIITVLLVLGVAYLLDALNII